MKNLYVIQKNILITFSITLFFIIHAFEHFFYTPWQGGSKGGDKGGVTFVQEIPILV